MKKQSNEEGSESSEPHTVKSCYNNLGEDPIQSSSQEYAPPQRPQSFKGFDDDNNWQDLSSAQKKQRNELIAQNLGIKQNNHQRNKNKFMQQNRNVNVFTDQILDSVQVSVYDSSHSQKNSGKEEQQKIIPQAKKKKSYFNVILIGAASTGKTTYKQCFLRKYKQKNQQKTIKQHTTDINEQKCPPMSFNLSLDFYIIDTPGYTHSSINNYSSLIQKQIKDRIERTKMNKKSAMTESSVYEKQERQIRDERIHCCLFFFRGPRLHSDDWRLMQQLYDKCNIIPIIAKGDSYTIQQVCELKKIIIEKAKQENIKWFDIEQYIRQKYPSQLNSITKGPYGPSPPFMIASSTTKIEKDSQIRVGREYKWGTCIIEDEKHTEFTILNKILTRYLTEGFVKMIDVQQDDQKAKIESKDKKGLLTKIVTFVGVIAVIGLISRNIGKHQILKK